MSNGATTAALSGTPTKERFLGVDVARGVALLSMLAANVFDNLDDNGEPTLAVMTVTGRAATMFVMVAGSAWRSSPVAGIRCKEAIVGRLPRASPSGLC